MGTLVKNNYAGEGPNVGSPKRRSVFIDFKDDLCLFSWDVLLSHLKRTSYPPFPAAYDKNLDTPLFVTWTAGKQGRDILRGCIGCLDSLKLHPGLQDYTIKAGFQDSRFPPIAWNELRDLTCRVSVLHSFEQATNGCYDWELGVHGIIIHFDHGGEHYSATYLPEIPLEHGMSREVAIEELCRKAGYVQAVNATLLSKIRVTRYQTRRVNMNAEEYLRFRPGVF